MFVALSLARGDPINTIANPKKLARNIIKRFVEVLELLKGEVAQSRKQDLLA
jgi:hypothetical protein